jgi:hypothetical protein
MPATLGLGKKYNIFDFEKKKNGTNSQVLVSRLFVQKELSWKGH